MKKLLHFDKTGFEGAAVSVEQTRDLLKEAIDRFNRISKLKVDATLFEALIAPDKDAVTHQLTKSTVEMMERAGIFSASLQKDAVGDALSEFEDVWPAFHGLAHHSRKELQSLTFENGCVVFSDKARKALEEGFKTFLSSDEAVKIHQAHDAIATALNNFCELTGVKAWQLPAYLFSNVIGNTGDTFTTRSLNYDSIAKQKSL